MQQKLAGAVGKDTARRICADENLQQLFTNEFEQMKADRDLLRTYIMGEKVQSKVIMPVNLPRLITNV